MIMTGNNAITVTAPNNNTMGFGNGATGDRIFAADISNITANLIMNLVIQTPQRNGADAGECCSFTASLDASLQNLSVFACARAHVHDFFIWCGPGSGV